MLTRRMFHTRLMAALAAAALPVPRGARAAAQAADDLWLNRLTFGASPAARAEIAALGREAWLDRQLALRPEDDAALADRLARARLRIAYGAGEDDIGTWEARDELRPLGFLSAGPEAIVPLLEWQPGRAMEYSERTRPAQEVVAASLIRAVHAEAQLREMVTQFWHDHFNVNADKDHTTAAPFALYDRALRTHALGNFRALLGEVAAAPAMLSYLNNADSRASPANENFARELLELHTLGAANYLNDRYQDWREVPGATEGLARGYLDLDVYEVARAFTGWSIGDGRWLAEGEEAPRTGQLHYVARWHDPYQKRVLGREFPPHRGPLEDGAEVLDILARHPGTARFICEKLARRFLSDDPPPALVERMAATFRAQAEAPDQIAQVLRLLVLSPEFAAPPAKLRRPFEFLAALYRATGAEVTVTENGFHWHLSRAGWRQHGYGPPTGHPDRIEAWTGASTLNRSIDLAISAFDDWFDGARADLAQPAGNAATLGAFAAQHADALAPGQGAGIAADLAGAFGIDPAAPLDALAPEDRRSLGQAAVAFAALTPEFLLR
ncbi:DUF1800 domain-containing protein [Rhodobacter calidifons]|uniref:DUF1800 domain-containing protein n=1 Tax=Rhodobacter calidifons TaxID=2715277 RepID=A0ABX0G917_9RHOB|nr:DUF1800 domain-containing protein [Rhodobacter calidifons]NHB77206.1 DUF1800 domain-containing protein [Rhodobacter calidifons]